MSVSILFEKTDGPIAQRAAKLVLATLKYRQALLENSLERETIGETVVDNARSLATGTGAGGEPENKRHVLRPRECEFPSGEH